MLMNVTSSVQPQLDVTNLRIPDFNLTRLSCCRKIKLTTTNIFWFQIVKLSISVQQPHSPKEIILRYPGMDFLLQREQFQRSLRFR